MYRVYQSTCLQSDIKCDGWRPANAKVSYFGGAIWFRLSQAQIWMSQSRSHQRAPFGFINSQRRSSLSIIAVIKMFWSCLAQTWNIFTEGITSQVWLLSSEKLKSFKSSFCSVVLKIKYTTTIILSLKPIWYGGMTLGTFKGKQEVQRIQHYLNV